MSEIHEPDPPRKGYMWGRPGAETGAKVEAVDGG